MARDARGSPPKVAARPAKKKGGKARKCRPKPRGPLRCEECGTTAPDDEVRLYHSEWFAGGERSHLFSLWREDVFRILCSDCEESLDLTVCAGCCALLPCEYWRAAVPENFHHGCPICPGCTNRILTCNNT
jgi:hypothetical protein